MNYTKSLGALGKNGATDERTPSQVRAVDLKNLLEEQQYKCALTGTDLVPENATIDHIIPVSEGGLNSLENLQIVRTDVNRAKNTMSQEAFISMCREVAAWADQNYRP